MKYIDLVEAFDEHDADVALLSTYNFDPIFFEKILLPTRSLSKSRRIIIFMDEQRWRVMCRDGLDSRALNRLYHVVPVANAKGVFHPKLQLLLCEDRATLLCGSHNLSSPGFTGNLELTAKVQVAVKDALDGLARPVWDALQFFRDIAEQQSNLHRRVVARWLPQLYQEYGWLGQGNGDGEVQLVHSLSRYADSNAPVSIWDRLQEEWGDQLEELTVVSPFYDQDLGMLRDVRTRYPEARLGLTAQEYQTNIPTETLGADFPECRLHTLTTNARRLHGKLVAWKAGRRTGYLVGSANFTRPALKGANIEACLVVRTSKDPVGALFCEDLERRIVTPDTFRVGDEGEPGLEQRAPTDPLELQYAALDGAGMLRLQLRAANGPPEGTKVQLRQGGESAVSLVIPWSGTGPEFGVGLEESQVRQVRGALMASLRNGCSHGAWTYVLQESTLERNVGLSGHERARRRIELTGGTLSRTPRTSRT